VPHLSDALRGGDAYRGVIQEAMREAMERVLAEYRTARTEPLTDHPLAALIGHDLADEVRGLVANDSYKITGSPGRGNWAETPWVSVFDRLVTETAQRGYYVVYLFRGGGEAVHLSINQGTTQVLEESGRASYLDVLRARARTFRGLLAGEGVDDLMEGPLDLGGSGDLTRGYEAGNIAAITYARQAIPDDEALAADLRRFLALYKVLIESSDRLAEDADPAALADAAAAGMEAQRERWHKRTERNPRLARDAKRILGTICMVCGFNFEQRYGEIGVGFIEAHHLTPFADLQGRPTQLDPATDFVVVCPNCHRMLHRQAPPLTPGELEALLT
jgi:5-methylcytosine-specific restriction protein A